MSRPRVMLRGKLPAPVKTARRLLAGRRAVAASVPVAFDLSPATGIGTATDAPMISPVAVTTAPRTPTSPSSGSTPSRRSQSLFVRRRAAPQAALARRARRVLALAWVGLVLAVAGAAATVLSTFLLLRAAAGARVDTVWPTAGNLASVLVVVAASMQVVVWTSAERAWAGRREFRGSFWLSTSSAARWIGAGSAVVVAVAARHHQLVAFEHDRAWWLVTLGACCAVFGAALAAIQRFRVDPRPMPPRRRRR